MPWKCLFLLLALWKSEYLERLRNWTRNFFLPVVKEDPDLNPDPKLWRKWVPDPKKIVCCVSSPLVARSCAPVPVGPHPHVDARHCLLVCYTRSHTRWLLIRIGGSTATWASRRRPPADSLSWWRHRARWRLIAFLFHDQASVCGSWNEKQ
jgi:hypothetical protein